MIHQEELDLLAVRYVTGEMDAAEVSTFEARLADDQVAREAVEFAVRVAVVSAEDAVAPVSALPVSVGAGAVSRSWGSLAAAAVLLVCVGVAAYFLTGSAGESGDPGAGSAIAGHRDSEAPKSPESAEDQVLIASWMAFGELEDERAGEVEVDDGLGESPVLVVDAGVVEPPDWMMQGLMK